MNAAAPGRTSCSEEFADSRYLRPKCRGVLLVNLGTPDHPDPASIRRYLAEFLSDPYVIKLPNYLRWMNKPLGRFIALMRAKTSSALYRNIWTDRGSPLKFITEDQVEALQAALSSDWRIYSAMRYGNPSIASVMERIIECGITDLIVIPMYPQYSGPTTGTALTLLYEWLRKNNHPLNIEVRNFWYDDAGYIEAQARLIHQQAMASDLNPSNAFLLYSTHSMPESYIRDGDPYEAHVRESVRLVNEQLGWPKDRTSLCFQSKLGPVPWLKPSTDSALRDLAAKGEKKVIVCPVSFTTDCLETLEEISIRYREMFAELGGEMFLCPALNTFDPFIKALSSLVRRGPHARRADAGVITPLFDGVKTLDIEACLDTLMMIGVSTRARQSSTHGPSMVHVSETEFNRIKRPQLETVEVLKALKSGNLFKECWIWNTCSRFECYGWLSNSNAHQVKIVEEIKHLVLGQDCVKEHVNVLHGRDVWHHMLRTATGLNSNLPGDAEVSEQLESSQRMAVHAGTAGPMTDWIVAEAVATEKKIRDTTTWKRFEQNYCHALIQQLFPDPKMIADANIVVIGGSITSHGILSTLAGEYGIATDRFTLVYRGYRKGRLVKMLRQATGEGECLLVEDYHEASVIDAITAADIVFFTTDQREPVLNRETLLDRRNLKTHPLTIVDFNTFGSCEDLDSIEGIRLISLKKINFKIERFATALLATDGFLDAAAEAEARIYDLVHPDGEPANPPARIFNDRLIEPSDSATSNGALEQLSLPIIDRDNFNRYAGLSLPRHVSYPMPTWWKDMSGDEAMEMYRRSNHPETAYDLSLYLHIPFCEALCKFCGCNRTILRKGKHDAAERTESYIAALISEITQMGRHFAGRSVGQIHWGGGTPTYLSCADIIRLHRATANVFSIESDAEISIEIDPRVTTHEQLRTLRELGFNRVSMGVQDFDEKVQKHIHRVQPFEVVQECVESCREVGFPSVNFDLIYGMPYQTIETIADTLERTLELSPDRIAFYHYAQIPEKIANQRGIHHDQMADSNTKLDMLLLAHQKFIAAGYEFIGLDHFARPDEGLSRALQNGNITRNFQGMTTGRDFDLIGLGGSSISHIKDIGYLQNVREPDQYVDRINDGVSPIVRGVMFSEDDVIRQSLLNDLYCRAEIDPARLEKQFDIEFATYFARELETLQSLEADGLVTIDAKNRIRVVFPLGRVLMRNVAAVFDAYLDPDAYRMGEKHAFSTSA